MKEKIHPKYFVTKATCACGATFDVGSTKKEIRVDICSACHPLFTGKQKLLDAEGRIQKFKKKYSGVSVSAKKKAPKKGKTTTRNVSKVKKKKK
ncbi:MAG: 50S ribosomal protein L31 [Candidatus Margulisbacteria bacterium]|nr:50S ribosomal protein L31 [Candidatus Margulisiibacteriota bacterium]